MHAHTHTQTHTLSHTHTHTHMHTQTSISLHWMAPKNNGSDITGYTLERDEGCSTKHPQPSNSAFSMVYAGALVMCVYVCVRVFLCV